MKVLIDGRKLGDSGIGRYVEELLRALLCSDYEDEYYVLVNRQRQLESLPAHARLHPVVVKAKLFSLAEQRLFVTVSRKLRPALIHVPHFNIPLFTHTPLVTTLHDIIPIEYPQELPGPPARIYYRFMNRQALHRSAAIMVPSHCTRAALSRSFAIESSRIQVVPEAAGPQFNRDPNLRVWAPLKVRLGLQRPFMLLVGLHKPHKRLPLALAALACLRERYHHLELQLLVVGPSDARYTPGLQALARKLKLETVVRWPGALPEDELVALYQQAQVLLCPSAAEGFGLTVLEAMACGAPVVGGDEPWLREVGGAAALRVPTAAPAGMAAEVHRLLKDENWRSRVVALGLAHASRFTWDAHARASTEIYHRVLQADRR